MIIHRYHHVITNHEMEIYVYIPSNLLSPWWICWIWISLHAPGSVGMHEARKRPDQLFKTHLPLDKKTANFTDDIWNAFSWMKIIEFWFNFLCFIPRGPINNVLAPNRRQVIIWTNAAPVHCRIYAALGKDELKAACWRHRYPGIGTFYIAFSSDRCFALKEKSSVHNWVSYFKTHFCGLRTRIVEVIYFCTEAIARNAALKTWIKKIRVGILWYNYNKITHETTCAYFITLRIIQNGRHFADDIFKHISFKKIWKS